ncbi:SDR family NAD(P)-dependent oxidoreductase [Cellulomonas sp. P5_C6]
MLNSLGQPDTVLLLGGASDIAVATALEWVRDRQVRLVIAARPGAHRDCAVASLAAAGASVEVVDLEATDPGAAADDVDRVFDRWEIDVALVAHGVLPDQDALERDPGLAAEVCATNFSSAVVVGLQVARRMTQQGHGVIVAISSIAAVRPRADNYVYGATKAGADAFFTGLRQRLRGTGVRVLVVRPGFVRTRMTAGLAPAPFAVEREAVGRAITSSVASRDRVVWVPSSLRVVAWALRLAPDPLVSRLATVRARPRDLSASSSDPAASVRHRPTGALQLGVLRRTS